METPVFIIIANVWVAIYEGMYVVFTENCQEAKEVALQLGCNEEDPFWWEISLDKTPENDIVINSFSSQLQSLLGEDRIDAFFQESEDTVVITGFVVYK